jgi:hypothetical protein
MSVIVRFVFAAAGLLAVACGPSADLSSDGGPGGGGDSGPQGCQGAQCQNHCPTGTMTTVRGTVRMPNGIDPVPQALVYVPREVTEFPGEVRCEVCDQISDLAIVSTQTADDGSFVLGPIPTAENQQPGFTVQLVAQKGRFRKLVDFTVENVCAENQAQSGIFDLPPRTNGFDNIPKIAVVSGAYDQMECVLLKLGIDQDAFDLYSGQQLLGPGNVVGNADSLLNDLAKMKSYNVIFLNCGNDYESLLGNATVRGNILDYVQSGGRLYVTDQAYDFVEQIEQFSPLIDFGPDPDSNPSAPETTNAAQIGEGGITTEAQVLQDGLKRWLEAVEAVTGDQVIDDQGRVHIQDFLVAWAMQVAVPANENSTLWLEGPVSGGSYTNEVLPLTTTFDYAQCGRVLYSSYHTEGGGAVGNFPSYCASGDLTPQERVLEYLILHIADCIEVE